MKIYTPSKKAITGLLILGVTTVIAVNIVLAVYGRVSIWFFSVVISFVFLLAEAVLRLASCTRSTMVNTRLLLGSVFVVIIIGDLVLRSSGKFNSYNEKIGRVFYLSPYHRPTYGHNTQLHLRAGRDTTEVETYPEFVCYLDLNSDGLRDINHPVAKATSEYRIVGLGDSFTEGCGAKNNDETWVNILANNFHVENAGKTTIFNGGVGGSDPFYEYLLLKDKLLKYQPDLVIVAINSSDIIDAVVRGGMERFQEDGSVKYKNGPWFEPLFGMSHLFRLIMLNVFNYDWYLIRRNEREELEQKALDLIYSGILMFEKVSQEETFDLLIVFHPLLYEVESEEFPFHGLIQRLEKENTIEVLDLLDFFLKDEKVRAGNAASYYWPRDLHHNKAGYALFSKGLKQKLESMNLPSRFREMSDEDLFTKGSLLVAKKN